MIYRDYLKDKYQSTAVKFANAEGVPCVLEKSKGKPLKNYEVYGNSVQDGTPSPEAPIEIQSVGDLVTDTASEYYGKYDIPITVTGTDSITEHIYLDEPLRKVGDYADYIDFKNQKVVRNIKELTFDGTENWFCRDTDKLVYLRISDLASSEYCYSTHFVSEATRDTINPYFRPVTGVLRLYQWSNNIVYSSIEEFKTFLANQNTAGAPLIVDYILTAPTEKNISLPVLKTFKGTSIISVDTSVQPSNIKAKYVRL